MFENNITFGTHASRIETRFTFGWLDDIISELIAGNWQDDILDFCPLYQLNCLVSINGFSVNELETVISEETNSMYMDIYNAILSDDKSFVDSIFLESPILYNLAKMYVVHRVAMNLYFIKFPLADFDLKIQSWVDIYKRSIELLNLNFACLINLSIPTRPAWVAPDELLIEKGVAGVNDGVVSMKIITKNVAYSR